MSDLVVSSSDDDDGHHGGGGRGGGGADSIVTHSAAELPAPIRARATSPHELPAVVAELLASGADAAAQDPDGNCPLYLSLHLRSNRAALAACHALLRRGAQPNARRHGGTMLHHALRLGRAPLVQRLLREPGAYPHLSGRAPPPVRPSTSIYGKHASLPHMATVPPPSIYGRCASSTSPRRTASATRLPS